MIMRLLYNSFSITNSFNLFISFFLGFLKSLLLRYEMRPDVDMMGLDVSLYLVFDESI